MDNFVVIAIIVAIIAPVVLYIVKAKKSGIKCIGCPDAKDCQVKGCGGNCQGCKGCGGHIDSE